MLIKYKNRVINLDQVTEFMKYQELNIRFYFNLIDDTDLETQQPYSSFFFETEEVTNEAFEVITDSYMEGFRVCDLDY